MPNLDLEALASSTAAALARVWDEVGVAPPERSAALSALAEAVAGTYAAAVDAAGRRAAALRDEVASLADDIAALATSLDVDAAVVRARRRRVARWRASRSARRSAAGLGANREGFLAW